MPQCFADTSGSLSWMPHFRPFPIIRSNAPSGNANPFKGPETATILGFILREILVDQESPGKLLKQMSRSLMHDAVIGQRLEIKRRAGCYRQRTRAENFRIRGKNQFAGGTAAD